MASAARRQIIGGGMLIIKGRRLRPQIDGGGAARPAQGFCMLFHSYSWSNPEKFSLLWEMSTFRQILI